MEQALGAGAAMVNDVSALTWDPRAAEVVAKAGCPVVLMHHQGAPETMQDNPRYDRPVLLEVYDWLEARIEAAVAAGIAREQDRRRSRLRLRQDRAAQSSADERPRHAARARLPDHARREPQADDRRARRTRRRRTSGSAARSRWR